MFGIWHARDEEYLVMTTPDLRVRLCLREALNCINDACSATTVDAYTVLRLRTVIRDLEHILAHLAPERVPLPLHLPEIAGFPSEVPQLAGRFDEIPGT